MATQQNIGAPPPNANKISIITKSEIRYEGILYHINPQDQNITLCNVKSFGTEGRRPGDEIAPSPQIHEYIIFRGSDIKDLKVIENAQGQPEPTTAQPEKPVEQSAPKEQTKTEEKNIKMGKEGNQEDFDFQAMKEKFHQFTLDHKQPEINSKAYSQKDFFDSLSTSTAEKTREIPFDRIAQKKMDKETFGSEYVDNATTRGRGGYRRGGGYRGGGGQNRRYGNNQQGGQNRNYGGGQGRYQNRNQGGYDNQQQEGGHGGQGGYKQGGYRGQGGYGGHGGQGGYGGHGQGGHGGQGGYGGHGGQGGYGGHGGHGGQGGYNQGQGGKYQSGPRYYKTYQTVSHDQDQDQQHQQQQQGGNEEGFRKY